MGPVQYSPGHGFPAYYFPYKNVKGYQSPIVAVQFNQPKRKCVTMKRFPSDSSTANNVRRRRRVDSFVSIYFKNSWCDHQYRMQGLG